MIDIGGKYLRSDIIKKIVIGFKEVEINHDTLNKVEENYKFLDTFIQDKIIYGINTGFGPMAKYKIDADHHIELQYNLIRSHASGSGNPLPAEYCRAAVLARLNSLLLAQSGIHPELIELLKSFLNNDICPVLYEHGGVGASGDLVQLAHLALSLIGEGEVYYKGEKMPTSEVLKNLGLKPIGMHIREGLALINGTSVMTGIGVVNIIRSRNLLKWSVLASSIINEIVESYDDHFSKELNAVKKHSGQNEIALLMRMYLKDSKLIRIRADHLFNGFKKQEWRDDKVQEFYSIRCVPQVLGPILDTIDHAEKVVLDEFNSVNDNPVINSELGNVYHGGNFHGDYISIEMDKLKIAVTKLSILSERQINYLMNDKLNGILPPFVNLGTLGLNLGMQGVQFTATSTTAENQTLSNPVYVHSIPNNNDNQDIVSMGTNSALMAARVIDNTYEVIAVEWLSILQAVDFLNIKERLSKKTRKYYDQLRDIVPVFKEDTIKYKQLAEIKNAMINTIVNNID